MLNIVFGSIKEPKSRVAEQEFEHPSVKIEKEKGSGKSRRILFNRPACELLDLKDGDSQEMLFGFAQPEAGGAPRLFVVNTEEFLAEVEQKTYRTSKNKASYDDSKERGKAIASKPLTAEITEFLGLDESVDNDLFVSFYQEGEATVYELSIEDPTLNQDLDVEEVVGETIEETSEEDELTEEVTNNEPSDELPQSDDVDFDFDEGQEVAANETEEEAVAPASFHIG